jgi:hypothetical protein
MTEATAKCAYCGERFELSERRGRCSGMRRRKRAASYVSGLYCCGAHRQAAYRKRRAAVEAATPWTGRGSGAANSVPGPEVRSAVTHNARRPLQADEMEAA